MVVEIRVPDKKGSKLITFIQRISNVFARSTNDYYCYIKVLLCDITQLHCTTFTQSVPLVFCVHTMCVGTFYWLIAMKQLSSLPARSVQVSQASPSYVSCIFRIWFGSFQSVPFLRFLSIANGWVVVVTNSTEHLLHLGLSVSGGDLCRQCYNAYWRVNCIGCYLVWLTAINFMSIVDATLLRECSYIAGVLLEGGWHTRE